MTAQHPCSTTDQFLKIFEVQTAEIDRSFVPSSAVTIVTAAMVDRHRREIVTAAMVDRHRREIVTAAMVDRHRRRSNFLNFNFLLQFSPLSAFARAHAARARRSAECHSDLRKYV